MNSTISNNLPFSRYCSLDNTDRKYGKIVIQKKKPHRMRTLIDGVLGICCVFFATALFTIIFVYGIMPSGLSRLKCWLISTGSLRPMHFESFWQGSGVNGCSLRSLVILWVTFGMHLGKLSPSSNGRHWRTIIMIK